LKDLVQKHEAHDATVRGTALAELEAMQVRTSQYSPGNEVPEKNWLYRLAKRYWFNDFGVYRGHDHSRTAAPGLLRQTRSTAGEACRSEHSWSRQANRADGERP
jgi:hypothetical protein